MNREIIRNLLNIFKNDKSIFRKNVKRWTKLPAGKERYRLEDLIKQSDKKCLETYLMWTEFWKEEKGWEHKRYKKAFTGKNVIEVGSGMGFDAYVYAQAANSYACIDINPMQIEFIQRIHSLMGTSEDKAIDNISYQVLEDPYNHYYGKNKFNAFFSHGVLHHVPFNDAKRQFKNINKYLMSGSFCVFLMYPKERWEYAGRPKFEDFGNSTDGGCPWTEWYDSEKILDLVGSEYDLKEVIPWGSSNEPEFVNFELIKK